MMIRSLSLGSKLGSPDAAQPVKSSSHGYDYTILVVLIIAAVGVYLLILLLCALAAFWLYMSRTRQRQRMDASRVHNRAEESQMDHNRVETFAMRDNGQATVNSVISRGNGSEFELRSEVRILPLEMVVQSTETFSMNRRLGEGSYSEVYRGRLEETNMDVFVKRISGREIQRGKNEANIASTLSHRNVVRFVGCCDAGNELLLVYEYIENGTLDSHLYEEGRLLCWRDRYQIVKGIASALHYLHEELPYAVLHRDIKPASVLLDRDFNVKLGGFSIAMLMEDDWRIHHRICGTLHYLDPNYLTTGVPGKEVDVYGFGLVALEISCGRKPTGHDLHMVHWVWDLYRAGNLVVAADPKLSREFNWEEMERLLLVGLWCTHHDSNARPSMRQVINMLNFEAPLPSLPLEFTEIPTFSPRHGSDYAESSFDSAKTALISPEMIPSEEAFPTSSKVYQSLKIHSPSAEISQSKFSPRGESDFEETSVKY